MRELSHYSESACLLGAKLHVIPEATYHARTESDRQRIADILAFEVHGDACLLTCIEATATAVAG